MPGIAALVEGLKWEPGVAEVCAGVLAGIASMSGSCQSAAAVLGLGVNESVCIVFKCRVSLSYSPLALLTVSPAGFQNQLRGFVFQVPVSRVGVLEVGTEPLAL